MEAEAGVEFTVVHADAAVAVVDKPAGLVVHPGAGHQEGTLVGGLLARFPDLSALVAAGVCPPDRPGIVHRLDKGTSGLLAVARTESAYARARGPAGRPQHAASLPGPGGGIGGATTAARSTLPSGAPPARRRKWRSRPGDGPPAPASRCWSAATSPRPTTLVELSLQSGRTHQIRVHMAAIGHPVVGDARYGTPEQALGPGRFFLHAFRLALHPPGQRRACGVLRRPCRRTSSSS